MKTTSYQFREHLDRDVTSLCTCWQIERTDGVVLRFTDNDQDVVVDGNKFLSIGAYSRSAIESTSSLSVDNLDVSGMATELALPIEELRAGAYDNAVVKVFMTSWMDNVYGQLNLRRGFFGEVRVLPNGTFTVELRGILQRLSHTYTEVFSATCRHDLGDEKCGIDLVHPFQTEGARIPFPFRDPDFEEMGAGGFGSSSAWYNAQTTEEMIDAIETHSGNYAAHATAGGGVLRQDIFLNDMDADFLTHLDAETIGFTGNAYRKDGGDRGRIRYDFLDNDLRPMRSGGYLKGKLAALTIPEVILTGDFAFEGMFNFKGVPSLYDGIFSSSAVSYNRNLYFVNGRLTFNWGDSTGDGIITAPESVTFPIGVWKHVALTRSGDVVYMYVDGVLVAQGPFPSTHNCRITRLFRGGSGFGNAVKIDVDELRIWGSARTQAEINRYRLVDLPTDAPNLRRYYPFDDNTTIDQGGDASGALGSEHDGVIIAPTNIAVSYRGIAREITTGYEDLGNVWTLRTINAPVIPSHTRVIRVSFDHNTVAGNPTATRVDGFFGWFVDSLNTKPYPNFSIGNNPDVWTRAGMVTAGGSTRIFNAIIDEPRAVEGWYQGGLVTFQTGLNAGASMEIKRWTASSGQIELFLSIPYDIHIGDLFTVYPGCDKSRICCSVFFNNMTEFFGTPDVPGEDELYRYPDAT